MEASFSLPTGLTKAQSYEQFLTDYRLLLEGETDLVAVLANTAAALREGFGFFWVGFYLVQDKQRLSLSPDQGAVDPNSGNQQEINCQINDAGHGIGDC